MGRSVGREGAANSLSPNKSTKAPTQVLITTNSRCIDIPCLASITGLNCVMNDLFEQIKRWGDRKIVSKQKGTSVRLTHSIMGPACKSASILPRIRRGLQDAPSSKRQCQRRPGWFCRSATTPVSEVAPFQQMHCYEKR